MLLFLSVAVAQQEMVIDTGIGCSNSGATGVVPESGAIEVPVDVAPAVTVDLWCGGESYELSLETEGGEVVASATRDAAALLRLAPDEDLQPDTTYVFRAAPQIYGGTETIVSFTTGSESTVGAEPPTTGDAQATWYRDFGTLSGTIEVVAGDDPDGLSVVLLVDDDGQPTNSRLADPDGVSLFSEQWTDQRPSELCFTVAQEDAAGTRTVLDPVCVEADVVRPPLVGGRCSAAPLSFSLLSCLAGLVMALRRRGGSPA